MSLKPVNNEEVLKVLDQRTPNGYGAMWSQMMGFDHRYVRAIKSGTRSMTQPVARALGFELRWVRRAKSE